MNRLSTKLGLLGTMVILLWSSCSHDPIQEENLDADLLASMARVSPTGEVQHFILPDPSDLDRIPQDPKNPLNHAKAELGKMLFHETGIALRPVQGNSAGTYSCASCHLSSAGFKPGRQQGIADGGWGFGYEGEGRTMNGGYSEDQIDAQGARPLSILNGAFVTNSFWNGQFGAGGANEGTEDVWGVHRPASEINHLGFSGLESQNIEGLDVHRMHMDRDVAEELGYKSWFDQAFPEYDEEERYSNLTLALALSAYIRTTLSTEAPLQYFLKGDRQALTDEEKRGGLLFFNKAGCARCHYGPSLGSSEFHALGVNDLYHRSDVFATDENDFRNLGRAGFTGESADLFKFKVPQLYNLKGSKFFFHGSSKESLLEVVEYFNDGVAENPNVTQSLVSDYFTPLGLTDEEVQELTAFLSNALFDPNLDRYVPSEVLSGNCFPNADLQALIDMDCE